MTTSYAARGSRQAVVLTAIAGFHVGLFLLIASGLGPRIFEVATPDPDVILIPREQERVQLAKPARPEPFEIYYQPAPEPDPSIPNFDHIQPAPTPRDGFQSSKPGDGALEHPQVEQQAPALRTRNGRLAALINSCYPPAARRRNEEGRAVARITIDASGKARAWSVAESSGFPLLDAASGCVIERIEFVAGRRDGRAVEAEALLPIVFRLD